MGRDRGNGSGRFATFPGDAPAPDDEAAPPSIAHHRPSSPWLGRFKPLWWLLTVLATVGGIGYAAHAKLSTLAEAEDVQSLSRQHADEISDLEEEQDKTDRKVDRYIQVQIAIGKRQDRVEDQLQWLIEEQVRQARVRGRQLPPPPPANERSFEDEAAEILREGDD